MEEINWFAIESKVRHIVREIIEPTIKRVQDIKEANEKILRKEDSLHDRMTSQEIVLAQTNQRLDNLNSFTSKIVESEASMRSFESRTTSTFDKVFSKFEMVNADILNLSEKFGVLDNQKTVIEESVAGLEKNLLAARSALDKEITRVEEESLKQFDVVDGKIRKLDSDIRQINRKIEGISEDLAETDYFARKSDRVCTEHADKFVSMQKLIQANRKELQDTMDKIRNSMFAHQKEAQDATKRLIKYIESDFKVSLNMGFMEHLYSVVADPRAMLRLAQYEKEKLHEWGSGSLSGTLKDAIERSKMRCQTIIETPLPEPIKKIVNDESKESLKQTESIKVDKSQNSSDSAKTPKSISEKNEEEEEEEEEKEDFVSEFLLENKQFVSERQGFNTMSMFAEPMYAPYHEVEMIDYMPFIQEAKQQVVDLRNEVEAELDKIRKKIEDFFQDNKKITTESITKQDKFIDSQNKRMTEMEFLINEALHECNMVSNLRKRDLSDLNSSISSLDEKFNSFLQDYKKNEAFNSEIHKKLCTLMEVLKMSIALQQQDEVDRESIALMGQKDIKLKGSLKKPVISMDKNCMSCTGEKPIIQSLFKMACLAYTPSPIIYSSQEFARKELISIQKRMIEGIPSSSKPEIQSAIEEKQKNRARSALSVRRNRPNSVPFPTNTIYNIDIHSSIASELPIVHRRLL